MKYFGLALYLLSYTSGFANMALTYLAWRQTRAPALLSYLVLLILFTCTVLDSNVALFVQEFVGWRHPERMLGFSIPWFVIATGFNWAGAFFIHQLSEARFSGWYRRFFLLLATSPMVALLVILILAAGGVDVARPVATSRWALSLLTVGFVAYSSWLFWHQRRVVTKPFTRKLMALIFVLNAIWVPFAVVVAFQSFPGGDPGPTVFSFDNVYYFVGHLISAVLLSRQYFLPGLQTPDSEDHSSASVLLKPERLALWGLSPREQEILGLLARGLINKEIAHHLGIDPSTVKNHLYRIYRKLGVSTRVSALHRLMGITDTPRSPR